MDKFSVMSVLLFLVVVIVASHVSSGTQQWHHYKHTHGKVYSNKAEESSRRAIWEKYLQYVENHNAEFARGRHAYSLSLDRHADLSHEEYKRVRFGSKNTMNRKSNRGGFETIPPWDVSSDALRKLPPHVDWRDKGFVSEVRDQGACSSSYAFAALGAIEGQFANKTGKLVTLSAQNIVDCSHLSGSDGCDGGFVDNTLDYDGFTRGVNTDADYPYTGREDQCRFNDSTKVSGIGGYVILSGLNETILQIGLATVGPMAAIMDASSPMFRFYQRGVLVDNMCAKTYENLLHTVLIVGYGTSEYGDDYWIVRNSWGKDWGMDGYVHMARNHDNMCGLSMHPVYPDVLL